MTGRYLLDTTAAVRVLNGNVDLVARRGSGSEILLSLVAVGELLFGAAKSARPAANRRRVEDLIEICPVLAMDLETAARYGEVKARLREKGRPIPENDIWIAASALQHSLILAHRDHHFEYVEGLQIETW